MDVLQRDVLFQLNYAGNGLKPNLVAENRLQ